MVFCYSSLSRQRQASSGVSQLGSQKSQLSPINRGVDKEDVVHTYCTMEYYSAIKKNKIMPFAATWMDLEIVILSEVSQTEKDKYHMISFICGSKINGTNELTYKTEIVTDVENKLMVTGGKGGRDKFGDWD